jgi:C4-dicarboxylate-binding protein DctP
MAVILAAALMAGCVSCGGEKASPTPTPEATPAPTAKPITLKVASSLIADSSGGRAYATFASLVEEYTDGRVIVDVYPGSQLFPATELWEAVTTGSVDIYGDSTYWVSQSVPDLIVFYVDGMFESYEHAYAVLEQSDVPQILADRVEEAGAVKMLGLLPAGMALCVLNSVRETKQLSDLNGLKCQSSPGAPPLPDYEYTGMAAVPLSLEETATAFVQGVIDAVNHAPTTIRQLRMYESGNHMLCRYSMFATLTVVVNRESWDRLPADVQDIIENEVMPLTYESFKQDYRESEQAALEEIEQSIETVNWVTEEDRAAYLEYARTHPIRQVQMLMIDPMILDIIEEFRPGGG